MYNKHIEGRKIFSSFVSFSPITAFWTREICYSVSLRIFSNWINAFNFSLLQKHFKVCYNRINNYSCQNVMRVSLHNNSMCVFQFSATDILSPASIKTRVLWQDPCLRLTNTIQYSHFFPYSLVATHFIPNPW